MKPPSSCGRPAIAGPVHRRQRDHLVRLEAPVSRGQDQLAVLALVGVRPASTSIPRAASSSATASLAAGPKMTSGASSGVTMVSSTSSSPSSSALPLRHQRDLVDRQRPGDAGRHHEGDPPRPLAGSKELVDPQRLAARGNVLACSRAGRKRPPAQTIRKS